MAWGSQEVEADRCTPIGSLKGHETPGRQATTARRWAGGLVTTYATGRRCEHAGNEQSSHVKLTTLFSIWGAARGRCSTVRELT